MSDMWSDDIGRCFCKKHRREICHKCCFDFTLINRRLELEAGIRQAPSQLETLTEQRVMLLNGIQFMRDNHRPSDDANLMFHVKELEKVEGKLAELKSTGTVEADEGETQSLHDAVEALTLSATQIHQNISDLRACGYCSKSNGVKLLLCSQCMKIAYCNSVCQKASWKDHKTFCKSHKVARDSSSDNHTDSNAEGNTDNKANDTVGDSVDGQEKTITKRSKLPLTWDQLEAYGGSVAQNKELKVRIMKDGSIMRQVFECQDRVGVIRRIAAYTNSKMIPSAAPGKLLRWKNPRFHWFMDGSSGARIEEEDLKYITVSTT